MVHYIYIYKGRMVLYIMENKKIKGKEEKVCEKCGCKMVKIREREGMPVYGHINKEEGLECFNKKMVEEDKVRSEKFWDNITTDTHFKAERQEEN